MNAPPKWQKPTPLELAATVGLPVVGILWFGWSGTQILLLYWLENVVVGVFNLLRMILTKPVYENRADYLAANPWILQHYPISAEDWQKAKEWRVAQYPSMKQFFVPFFLGHYSFFLLIHGFLLATLVGKLPAKQWWTFFSAQWTWEMWAVIGSMVVSQGWRFWTEDLQGRRHTRTCPFLAMVYPYRRLLILHVALFLGGFAIVSWSLPAALAILLILVKAGFDMNWIRIPLGPKKIDWKHAEEWDRKKGAGRIVGKTVNERPAGCHAELNESASGLRFDLAARGVGEVWKKMRAGGCLIVGLILLGMISFWGFVFIGEQWRTIMNGGGNTYWFMLLIMTLAQLLGTLWILMFSLLLTIPWSVLAFGTRRGTIELKGDRLLIRQKGFPWPRNADLPAREIVDLGMSPTGSKTNDFAVLELRIRLQNGHEHTFFAGREADELNWIATQITNRLVEL
ncbi:MAG: DUF6498-containing protein [Limisphaerales bacterium]